MENKEFEKQLEKIKELKEVPLCVDEKIQKAFARIEEDEKQEKNVEKQKGKINFSRLLSLAASAIVFIFLAGNGVAYANGEPNIYSWILEKIGIAKDYEEIKTNINKTVEKNGVKITLLDAGYDKNYLVIGYKIQSEEVFFGDIEQDIKGIRVWDHYMLQDEDGTIIGGLDYRIAPYVVNKISDKEYILYSFKDISDVDIKGKKLNFSVNIYTIEGTDSNGEWIEDAEIKGEWKFVQESIGYTDISYEEYVIDINKTINEEFKINGIKVINTKMFSAIYVDPYHKFDYDDYPGIPQYNVVLLEDGKAIADSSGQFGFNDSGLGMFCKKIEKNKTYTVQVRKREFDPKDVSVIVKDTLLEELSIELNDRNRKNNTDGENSLGIEEQTKEVRLSELKNDIRIYKLFDNKEYEDGILIITRKDENNIIWTYRTEKGKINYPATVEFLDIIKDKIYINELGTIKALDKETGKIIWQNSDLGGFSASFCFDSKGNLYIVGENGPALCIIDKNGKTLKKIEKLNLEYDRVSLIELINNEKELSFGDPYVVLNLEDYSFIKREMVYHNDEYKYSMIYTKKDKNNNTIWTYKTEMGLRHQYDSVEEIDFLSDKIYINENGTLVVLDKENGKVLWKKEYSGEALRNTWVDEEQNLYIYENSRIDIIDSKGNVKAKINTEDWIMTGEEGFAFDFINKNELLITSYCGGDLLGEVVVNLSDYTIKYMITFEYTENDKIIIRKTDEKNNIIWKYETEGNFFYDGDFIDDKLYIIEEGKVIALNVKTGKIIWQNSDFGGNPSYMRFDLDSNGNLYIVQGNTPNLFIINKNGETVKRIESFDIKFERIGIADIEFMNDETELVITATIEDVVNAKIIVNLKDYSIKIEK